MREVTQEEFFKAIGNRDVHPRIVDKWSDETGYTSEWRLRSISQWLVGKSQGPYNHVGPNRYWLPCGPRS